MEKKSRSQTRFIILFVVLACLLWAGSSQAQDYPKGSVQMVIPYSPGGLTDIFWRSISEELAKNIKGNLALVNKPGGAGVVGTSFVVNSKPDGYTLVNASPEALTIAPAFTATMPYDSEKDLTYIGKASVVGMAVAVRSESPFKTLEELVAFAKANPKKLKAAGMGIAGTPHMILGRLQPRSECRDHLHPLRWWRRGCHQYFGRPHRFWDSRSACCQSASSLGANSHPGRLCAQTAPEFP